MKILPRIIVVASLVGMFLPGSAPDRAQAIQPGESQNQVLYLPYVNNSYYPVTVLYSDFFNYRYSTVGIVGQIINYTHETVYNVNITADVFENGILTHTYTDTTMLTATFPGGTNPYNLLVGGEYYIDTNNSKLAVRINSYEFDNEPKYLPLTVVSKIYIPTLGNLTGQIRNDTSKTIEDIEIVLDGFDEFYTSATVNESSLPPGESTTYTAHLFYPRWQDGDSYSVWAQGAVAP